MTRCLLLFALTGCYNRALFDQRLGELEETPCQPQAFFEDADGDGYGAAVAVACEAPEDHVEVQGDCDDGDPTIHPDATEVGCNQRDDDCDPGTPDAADADGDGFGACIDCDDDRADVHPGAPERCNGIDDDCDGEIDTRPTDGLAWFADGDGDGFGSTLAVACVAPLDHVAVPGDCDDADPTVNPAADEDCDPLDRDCDGDPIAGTPLAERPLWFVDADGDGVGTEPAVASCSAVPDHVQVPGDCDDADPHRTVEVEWYVDDDRDGYGTDGVLACFAPPGRIEQGGDCDDADSAAHPGATEFPADGVDTDCDGFEACWIDADADGYGGSTEPGPVTCGGIGGDCDDSLATVNPSRPELPGDGFDSNCDGQDACFADLDGDGWGAGGPVACTAHTAPAGDCDDLLPSVHPWAVDIPGDGIDQDCDGVDRCWVDTDGDGFGLGTTVPAVADCSLSAAWANRGGDCAPGNGDRFPGAPEIVGDGQDQDCDGVESCYPDADQDGVGAAPAVPVEGLICEGATTTIAGDCDDADAARRPGATEISGDGIDQNCDGLDLCYLDADGDGYGGLPIPALACVGDLTSQDDDCDDSRAEVNPGAVDLPADGVDTNCDSVEWCFTDLDGDGSGVPTLLASPNLACTDPGESEDARDCDDTDPAVYPGLSLQRDVPSVYATVQAAVDAACDSDTVFVERGVYTEAVDLGDKDIQLRGEGPALTTLMGTVRLERGSLESISVLGGSRPLGGCVRVDGPAELRNVQVESCTGTNGGGVWLGAGARWIGGRAYGNVATLGGGAWLEDGASIEQVSFEANAAPVGAALAALGTVGLQRVEALDNHGATAVDLLSGTLDGVLVAGNTGGGILATELDAAHVTSAGNGGVGISTTSVLRATQWILAFNDGVGLEWQGDDTSPVTDSLVFGNVGGPVSGLTAFVGTGNVQSLDPSFVLYPTTLAVDDWDLHLRPGSPGRGAGPGVDPDGSGEDRGAHGGMFSLDHAYYADTDSDGLDDGYELTCGLVVGLDDADGDPDGDNLTNLHELEAGTRADRADTDGDLVNDDVELGLGTDPRSAP